jgi:hypothetical protein
MGGVSVASGTGRMSVVGGTVMVMTVLHWLFVHRARRPHPRCTRRRHPNPTPLMDLPFIVEMRPRRSPGTV